MQRGSKAARAVAWTCAVVIGSGHLPSAMAVSLASTMPAQPATEVRPESPPTPRLETGAGALVIEHWVNGSSSLMPLMVADITAPPADLTSSGAGEPLDGVGFIQQATEISRQELHIARDGVSRLQDPALRRLAGQIVMDHQAASSRLSALAKARGWRVPAQDPAPSPAPTAEGVDFDARWRAVMIAGQERLLALHRVQANSGVDTEIRHYALDTLPVFERQLAELEDLQK